MRWLRWLRHQSSSVIITYGTRNERMDRGKGKERRGEGEDRVCAHTGEHADGDDIILEEVGSLALYDQRETL
eukprot:COSAG06_NODE_7928_length_2331_cov_2.491935_2_plen_72_part_00